MSFHYVGPEDFDVEEGFFDDFLGALPGFAPFEWNGEFATNCIFEIDWFDFRSNAHEKNDEVILALLLSADGNTGSLAGVKSFGLVDSFADFLLVG